MSRIFEYGRGLNSHDLLKIIAISLMIIDHIGEFLYPEFLWLRLLGRSAAPLFFFLIGYVNHLHLRPTLFIYGFILTITAYFQFNHVFINVLLNMIFIQYCLWMFPPEKISLPWRCVFFVAAVAVNCWLSAYVEYGLLGLLFAYSARLIALRSPQASYWMGFTLIAYVVWETILFGFYKNPVFVYIFVGMLTGLYFIFMYYRMFTLKPRRWQIPLLLLSRYSLDIYFFHFIGLQGVFLLSAT